MAEKRTRARPEARSTSMESPSDTRVTRASSMGDDFSGSAGIADPRIISATTPPVSLLGTYRLHVRRRCGRSGLFDLLCLMRTMYHIRAHVFSILGRNFRRERH